ncbi:MAG: phage tail tape measure protein, partial [Nanoarchaeota archaeon]|nr:phage tail tape measure protein [Nanoarchaeota archaeon]
NNLKSLSIQLGQVLIPIISDLVKAITPVLKSFSRWVSNNKPLVATIMKVAAVMGGLSFAISAISAVVGVGAKAMVLYAKAQKAMIMVTKAAAAAQKIWNAIQLASPIGAMILAAAALAAAIYLVVRAFNTQSRAERLANEVRSRALDKTIDQRVEVMMLFKALRRVKVGTDEYNSTLQKIEAIQPGIIEQYKLQSGALDDINRAEQALTKSIIKRAEAEVRAELLKEKIKEAELKKQELGEKGILGKIAGGVVSIATLGTGGTAGEQKEIASLQKDINKLANQVSSDQMEASGGDPGSKKPLSIKDKLQSSVSRILKESRETLSIDFKNMPKGVEVEGSSGANVSIPNVGKTR